MRKRRVLAILLALSLVVSGNGMTVLAAETGAEQSVVTTQEETTGTSEESEETETADTTEESEESETPGTTQEPEEGETPETTENPEEQEDPDAPKEDETEEQPAEDVVTDPEEEQPVEDETEDPEEEQAEPEEAASALQNYVSRMVTFTDDTGMKVTYDANASQQYIYEVDGNGVLTDVKEKKVDAEGKETHVSLIGKFEGNVVLEQPKEGAQYTSVAASVFSQNTDITYVKLPAGVETITKEAFKGCTALKGVYLPVSVNIIEESAFEGCTAMTQISVPKAVTSIGDRAFKGDAKLYLVYMKDVDYSDLTAIGESAFENCTALSEFCSDTQFLLPAALEDIGIKAFYGCNSIKKLDLDATELKNMGTNAFSDCIGLTDAVMSKTLPVIPQYAFSGCTALKSLTFESKPGQWVKIDQHAFEGCYGLKSLVLPGTISEVADFAFAGCTNLYRIEVNNDNLIIGTTNAFPVGATINTLQFIGRSNSTIAEYCRGKDKVVFIKNTNDAKKGYYKYVVENSNGIECADGKVPGGQVWIGKTNDSKFENNINTFKDEKGNAVGVQPDDAVKYRVYYKAETGYSLVSESLRANGEILKADKNNVYYVTMPVGGIVITAEFRQDNASEKVNGQEEDIVVEYSNGELIENGVELKVGQTTRIFLIDKSGVPIDSSKIKKIESSATSVAKVSKSGVVTAAKAGTATITITLIGGDSKEFRIQSKVKVVEVDVDAMKLKATAYDSAFKITEGETGIQTASIGKSIVRDESLSITLKANAYTADKEGVAKDLTWKSSDTKIVKLQKASTSGGDSTNVLEIQQGCEGEATITVTAKNSSTAPKDKQTITQKFVVSVQNTTGKLASSSIKVNPNLEEGGELEVLLTYGAALDSTKTTLYKQGKDSQGKTTYDKSLDFVLEAKGSSNNGKSYRYNVKPSEGTKDGTYKLFVGLNGNIPDAGNLLPLTITVKRAVPTPTVKFNTKKTKFNLFYKNGGEDKDGNPITVTTEITKLGTAKIKKVELEALSAEDDDQAFLANFEIEGNMEEKDKNTITIKRTNENLKYTVKGQKPAVTGYLVIYYEGYFESVAKKVKVTMPTTTTAPAYVLDRTSVTYRDTCAAQQETLSLLDKKTKKKIVLDAQKNKVTVDTDLSAINNQNCSINEDGQISFRVAYPDKGKVKFVLSNSTDWDKDKNGNVRTLVYTFNVKTTSAEPTIKTDQKSVTLNLNYPESIATFGLVSNQKDTVLKDNQEFTYNLKARNAEDYKKMSVDYENGQGVVKIKDKSIKAGTYTWACDSPVESDGTRLTKKVTLTVKVINTPPVVKLGKGSLALNLASANGVDPVYTEKAELPAIVTGRPEGYTLDTNINMGNASTKIECTTKNEAGKEAMFNWVLEDEKEVDGKVENGRLSVSLGQKIAAKTYTFKMTQRYESVTQEGQESNAVLAKPVTFSVKVYSNTNIEVSFSAKGKLNLVDRSEEYTAKNSIIYTPTLKNIKGRITEAKIYDADTDLPSRYFDLYLDNKDGKIYVSPKKKGNDGGEESEAGSESDIVLQDDAQQEDQYVALENNKQYRVKIWVKVEGYSGRGDDGGIWSKILNIKTAQVLPGVTTDKTILDVHLSNKKYDATFTVTPKTGSVGEIVSIGFREDDEVPNDAFEVTYEKQSDGSLKAIVHLKDAVAYACDSTNTVKFYVTFKGQGINTDGTPVTMKIKVNK